MRSAPRLTRFLALAALGGTAILLLLRVIFYFWFDSATDPAPFQDVLKAFYLGTKFDLRLVLLILLPLALVGWIKWLSPFHFRGLRLLWSAYLAIASAAVLVFYVFDFGYYAYLKLRIDQTILRFLEDAAISFAMVWESYPVIWITLGFLVATVLLAWGAHRLLAAVTAAPDSPWKRRYRALAATATVILVLLGIYGKLAWYPLRWSEAFFSSSPFVSALGLNPVLYFYDTYHNGGVSYDREKVVKYYPTVAEFLKLGPRDPEKLDFSRYVQVPPRSDTPNVVLVFLESFAWYKTGLSGNPLQPTPNFDALANAGMLFERFYVPHTGTARSVFTTITGIPDVQLGETASRNPTIVDQHTIVQAFQGYERFYFLGGSANWGNIRGVLTNNIDNLQVYEEGAYSAPRQDVWGISDLDLFREATGILAQRQGPFFAIIQTAGNHRPYTIPADNAGFELRHPEPAEAVKYGFESVEEFNSFRFMDHSIGEFMRLARQAPWFDDTVFVFFGDHGISGDAGRHMPPGEGPLEMGAHRTPLVLYGPKVLGEPQRIEAIGSHLDILPTVAAATGHSYWNTTLGRNLFDPRYDDQRFAFTIQHRRIPTVGLVDGDFVMRVRGDGKDARLYQLGFDRPVEDIAAEHPDRAAWMRRYALALYETSRYLLAHNGHRDLAAPDTQASNETRGEQ